MARQKEKSGFLIAIMEDSKDTGIYLTDAELLSNATTLL
jgi:hypothetical protein